MSSRNEKVMELVESALKKNPDVENQELYERAKKVDSDIGDLTLRQFHARYPLQVKRRRAAEKKTDRKTRRAGRRKKRQRSEPAAKGVDREAVQEVLLDFARDLSAAEGKADMVDLLTNLDRYVDRVVRAADRGR